MATLCCGSAPLFLLLVIVAGAVGRLGSRHVGLVIPTYVATLRSNNVISRAAARVRELSFSTYLLHFTLAPIVITRHW
jgi:hypothetical protein